MISSHNRFSLLNDEEFGRFEDGVGDTSVSIVVGRAKKKSKKKKNSKKLAQDIPDAIAEIHNTTKFEFPLLSSIFWSFLMYIWGYVLRRKSELYRSLFATFSDV